MQYAASFDESEGHAISVVDHKKRSMVDNLQHLCYCVKTYHQIADKKLEDYDQNASGEHVGRQPNARCTRSYSIDMPSDIH
jgi:hypothetical protein